MEFLRSTGKREQAAKLLVQARESYVKLKLPHMAEKAKNEERKLKS
jgi:hypothetical protein